MQGCFTNNILRFSCQIVKAIAFTEGFSPLAIGYTQTNKQKMAAITAIGYNWMDSI